MSNDLARKAVELLQQVKDNGWEVRENGRHPVAFGGPKGVVPISTTPSDMRGVRNLELQLKRAGYLDPRPGAETKATKKEARRARGKRRSPSQRLRTELKKILAEMGEKEQYQDPTHRGNRGGARAKLIPAIIEAYEECGIEAPGNESGFYMRIKSWLAGDPMYSDQVTVLAALVAKHNKPDVAANGTGYQAIAPGKGLVTMWRCKECQAEFETKDGLAVHLLDAHEIREENPSYLATTVTGTAGNYVVPQITHTYTRQPLVDDLHIQVLAAILDPSVTREEAFQLAEAVRNAVGNH